MQPEQADGLAVVLCALPVEYRALRAVLADLTERELAGGLLFEEGRLPGSRWRVAVGELGEGNIGAGILAERAMNYFAPHLVLFVGVAGALKDDVMVGDVIVATRVDAYSGGKAAEDFLARPRSWDAPFRLEQRARAVARTSWPPADLTRADGTQPAVHLKPIAAGEVVLANRTSPLYEHLRLHFNDTVAIEMEGAGLAQAAHINDNLPALVIRGISDTTSPEKAQLDAAGWQQRAADHAASYAAAFLRALQPQTLRRSRPTSSQTSQPTGPASGPVGRVVRLPADRRHLPDFAGRQQLLDRLRQQLTPAAGTERLPVVLTGIGGVGKTQLAVEHAHAHRDVLDVIWTIRADTPALMVQDLADLATALKLPGSDDPDLTVAADLSRGWLVRHDRWLLVLDNAEGSEQVDPLIPDPLTGQLLVTTRNPSWPPRYSRLDVTTLSLDAAAGLLTSRTGDPDQAAAHDLAETLGGLPLAVEQAAAYCEQTGRSLSGYRQLLDTAPAVLDQPAQPGQATITRTVTLARQQVAKHDLAAATLLDLLAYLAPDAIPRALFANIEDDSPNTDADSTDTPLGADEGLTDRLDALLAPLDQLSDELAFDSAIRLLQRYGLITATADTLTVHRLTQTVLRAGHADIQSQTYAQTVARLVWDALPVLEPAAWPVYQQLLPHALAGADHALQHPDPDRNVLWLLLTVGSYTSQRGLFDQAVDLHQQALALARRQLPADDPSLIDIIDTAGWTLCEAGRPDQARPLLEEALSSAQAQHGADSTAVGEILTSLGLALRGLGDPAAAQPLFERALSIAETSYGPDSRAVIGPVSRLGNLHAAAGEHEQAIALLTRDLTLTEQHFGPGHCETATAARNLAAALEAAGRPGDALPHRQSATQISETLDPPEPELHGRDLLSLARVQQQLGRFDDAQRTLRGRLALAPGDAATATACFNLATALRRQGRTADAVPLFKAAWQVDEAVYGPGHPELATDLAALADTLLELNQPADALERAERALAILVRSWGEQDLRLLNVLRLLADARQGLGQPAQALSPLQHARRLAEAAWGPHDHRLIPILRPLSHSWQATGQHRQAVETLQQLAVIHDRSGGYTLDVADDLRRLAEELLAAGRPVDAIPHLQTALDIDRAAYGSTDPRISIDLTRLAQVLDLTDQPRQATQIRRQLTQLAPASGTNSPPGAVTRAAPAS